VTMVCKVLICVAMVNCTTIQNTTSILCCVVHKCEAHRCLKIINVCVIFNNWLEEAGRSSVQALLLGIYGTTCIFGMIIIELDVGDNHHHMSLRRVTPPAWGFQMLL